MTKYHVLAYISLAPHPVSERMTSDEFDTYDEARSLADRIIRSTGINAVFVERQKPGRNWQILLADDSGDDA